MRARPRARPSRYVGAAVRFDQIREDSLLRRTLLADCTSLTPEIHMKWDALQPGSGVWNFAPADDLAAFARQNNFDIRGHTLIWDQSTPDWAKRAMRERRDWSIVGVHIDAVVGRYAGAVTEWDVVNEPVGDPGQDRGGLRETSFLRAYGSDYIERALRQARSAAPAAKLAINDYGFDYDNACEAGRRSSFLRLVEHLRARDVPIDSVGIQAHLDLAKGPLRPEVIGPFLRELSGMGVEIAITELDVKEHDLTAALATRDARVADEVARYLDIVLDEPTVRGVTTWGLSDRHSWLQSPGAAGPELNRGLPYDADMTAKPMRKAIRDALSS